MKKLSTLLIGAAALGLAASSAAFALASSPMTGAWNYKVGAGDACTVTLSEGSVADAGTIASAANCPTGLSAVAYWRLNGETLELKSGNGDLVALLHKSAAGYAGSQIGGGRHVTLTRA